MSATQRRAWWRSAAAAVGALGAAAVAAHADGPEPAVSTGATAIPGPPIVVDLFLMLAAAALVAMGGRYFRVPTIPAYLITGALIGRSALGLIGSGQNVESISGLALIMLMFTIGLQLDARDLARGAVGIIAAGAVTTLAVVLALWPLTGAGLGAPAGLAVALALSMSSTAVVMRIMHQRRESRRAHGRLITAALIVQDLLALVFLAMMPVLSAWGAPASGPDAAPGSGQPAHSSAFLLPDGMPTWARLSVALLGVSALIVLARLALPSLMREAARGASAEVPLVLASALALLSAGVTSGLGFSPELGAFLGGFVLSGTAFRHQLAGQLNPMRDLFMAVFFIAVGLTIDLGVLGQSWPVILVALPAVLALKAAAVGLTLWLAGAAAAPAAIAALALCQAGEFSIVLLAAAHGEGLLSEPQLATLVLIVGLSLVLTPALYALGHRLRGTLERVPLAGFKKLAVLGSLPHDPDEHDPATAAPDSAPAKYVIIAGFGVVGRALADRFDLAKVPFCVVDLNLETIRRQRRLGRRAVYGDITNPEVLESAGVRSADVVVLTIPDDDATLNACRALRGTNPGVFIAARTSYLSKAMNAMLLGADMVVVEEVATAEAMARQVMDTLGRRATAKRAAEADRHAHPNGAATASTSATPATPGAVSPADATHEPAVPPPAPPEHG